MNQITLTIDGKEVRFRTSAALPRIYRRKFNRDIIVDLEKLGLEYKKVMQAKKDEEQANLAVADLETFENLAYIMAKMADEEVPDSVDDWLDQFDTFDIYQVLPKLMDLWKKDNKTLSVPKKKLG